MTDTQTQQLAPAFLYAYRLDGKGGGTTVDLDFVSNWSKDDGTVWLHIDVADPGSSQWLTTDSGLPKGVVEVLLADETRPRSNIYPDGVLVVLRGVNTNPGNDPEDMVSVRVWIDEHRIVSSRRRRLLSVVDLRNALDAGEGPSRPGEFLASLIERLADRIGSFVDAIEDSIDGYEETVENQGPDSVRLGLAATRRQIASVRRFLAPQRDALDRLNRQPPAALGDADAHALRQEADRITRYLEDLDLARERAIVLQEELLAQIAQEQNSRMYVLSLVAALFLPLTFITGLLGMNVGGLPGVDSPTGFTTSMIIMAVAGVALFLFFRWKRWL